MIIYPTTTVAALYRAVRDVPAELAVVAVLTLNLLAERLQRVGARIVHDAAAEVQANAAGLCRFVRALDAIMTARRTSVVAAAVTNVVARHGTRSAHLNELVATVRRVADDASVTLGRSLRRSHTHTERNR